MASHFHATTLHALGVAWLASQTLKDAFARLIRYSRMITDAEKFVFEGTTQDFRFKMLLPNGEPYFPYEDYDAAFAIAVKLCRMSIDEDFSPKHIRMRRPEPAWIDSMNIFAARLIFLPTVMKSGLTSRTSSGNCPPPMNAWR